MPGIGVLLISNIPQPSNQSWYVLELIHERLEYLRHLLLYLPSKALESVKKNISIRFSSLRSYSVKKNFYALYIAKPVIR